MTPKLRIGLTAFLVFFSLDVGTKMLVDANVHYGDRIPVIDGFFYITHVRNTGAAFGLFADTPIVPRMTVFIGMAIVALGIIASFFRSLSPGDRLAALGLGMILGGACGNLSDRIFRQEVVDFLHFRLWRGYTWPDFNIADTAIVVGVSLLILEMLATEGDRRASDEGEQSEA
jgi:signal peptidase II